MAWTTPVTHVTGAVVTASDWNGLANDLTFLSGGDAAAVDTSETTASTTFTDLTTVGPAVTVLTGAHALVIVSCLASNNTAGDGACMSWAISGATTLAAADAQGCQSTAGTTAFTICSVSDPNFYVTLVPGSNTFTAKYRAITGGTATFVRRHIAVIPLP